MVRLLLQNGYDARIARMMHSVRTGIDEFNYSSWERIVKAGRRGIWKDRTAAFPRPCQHDHDDPIAKTGKAADEAGEESNKGDHGRNQARGKTDRSKRGRGDTETRRQREEAESRI